MMSQKLYSGDSMEDKYMEKKSEAGSSVKKKGNGYWTET